MNTYKDRKTNMRFEFEGKPKSGAWMDDEVHIFYDGTTVIYEGVTTKAHAQNIFKIEGLEWHYS